MLQKYGLGWWALQLPAVRVFVGSSSFRQFEQQVNFDKANCVVLIACTQKLTCHWSSGKSTLEKSGSLCAWLHCVSEARCKASKPFWMGLI